MINSLWHIMPLVWRRRSRGLQLLQPIALLYQWWRQKKEHATQSVILPVPVICVGNVTVGGTGKTPVVMALAEELIACGYSVMIISKGYGGKISSPTEVNLAKHTAADVGDEPLLLARITTTIVGKSRVETARYAIERGADILILDDGFQDFSIRKTLNVLVIDSAYGLGNEWTLPAGPLREPWSRAHQRADAIVLMGDAAARAPFADSSLPTFRARFVPLTQPDPNERYFAFSGIGNPEKFFKTLRDLHLNIVGTKSFPDHHPFTHRELLMLAAHAELSNAFLITTEKDAVRIPSPYREAVRVVPVALEWDRADAVNRILMCMGRRSHGQNSDIHYV